MSKNVLKKNELSTNEEIMMFCAYRYAIGRHTYVSCLAPYIAQNYYDRLSDERKVFAAEDIRREIAMHLSFGSINFNYDGSVSEHERTPIEDYLQCLLDNNITKDDFMSIERIRCYKEHWADNEPKKFEIVRKQQPVQNTYFSEMDINDLLPWSDLAAVFDVKRYKKVTTKYNGKVTEHICFESWKQAYDEKENGLCYSIPFKWVPCYKSVEYYLKGNTNSYLDEKNIISVENV